MGCVKLFREIYVCDFIGRDLPALLLIYSFAQAFVLL